MFETTITIVGNIIDAPYHRRFDSGSSVTSFRLASTSRKFDKAAKAWADGESLFVKVSCWRALADNVYRSVVKGDPVVVTGKLCTKHYEQDGQPRTSYEVEAQAVGLDLAKGQASFFTRTRGGRGEVPSFDLREPDGEMSRAGSPEDIGDDLTVASLETSDETTRPEDRVLVGSGVSS